MEYINNNWRNRSGSNNMRNSMKDYKDNGLNKWKR